MFSRIASGHNHLRSIGINSVGLHPYSVFIKRRVYNTDYLRHIYVRTAPVGGQQFRIEWRKLQTRIMLELYYPFFHYCLLYYRYVMFQKRFLSKPKLGSTNSR